jgi:hypothetical protein
LRVSAGERLKHLLVESPNSLGEKARKRRWQTTLEYFPQLADMDVIDLGGTVDAWQRAPVRPRSVTILNLDEPGESDEPWLHPLLGDACDAVAVLSAAGARTEYDVVFSNAVLEHVGGHANRQRFAESVAALAPRHWVQTPYRYFPVEPHWLFPGMQFLPVAARIKIAESWPLVHSPHPGFEAARREVLWTELISVAEMRAYFPASRLVHEKVAGLTKSIIAVRT